MEEIIQKRGIETYFGYDLVKIDPATRSAYFKVEDSTQNTENPRELVSMSYDLLHVSPPMSAPDFIQRSPLANAAGWVDVDKNTMQHTKFANIFSLGDASSLPTSKTGAAIRKQAPVLVEHLWAYLQGTTSSRSYDGYTSCPLVTGYGKLILAEFDYDGNPKETFPFNQAKERYSMYLLKKYVLPLIYWKGMLKGRC